MLDAGATWCHHFSEACGFRRTAQNEVGCWSYCFDSKQELHDINSLNTFGPKSPMKNPEILDGTLGMQFPIQHRIGLRENSQESSISYMSRVWAPPRLL